jgi:hypothetical protein
MISKKAPKALLVSALALLFTPALSAKGFSYSYADVGYQRVNGDHYDVDEAVVNASFGVHDLVALQGGYVRGWTDGFPKTEDPSGNPDLNQFQVGLRPHYSFTNSLDAYGDVIYVNSKFNGDRSHTDIGWVYAAGIRYQAFKRVEFRVAGEYQSGDVDEAFLVIGPVIKLTRDLDLSLRTAHSSDSSNYFAGLRLNF